MSACLSRRDFVRRIAGVGAVVVLSGCASSSAPTTRPTSQPTKVRRIGYLFGGSSTVNSEPHFRERLRELGYVEHRDIVFESRTADNVNDRLPGLLSELIGLPVDVLVTQESPATLAATRATRTTPIVFIRVQDPVGQGMVASLARPGRNITGVAGFSAGPKGLELLQATVPGLKRIAVLLNANNPQVGTLSPVVQEAARVLGLELQAFSLRTSDELETALESIARSRPDALWVNASFTLARDLAQIPDFAAKHQLPLNCSTDAPFVRAGCLMAVGSNFPSQARRGAELVDRILKGAHPADLPVEVPTQLDVIVNLAAADRIGLTIPDSVLRQATEFVPR